MYTRIVLNLNEPFFATVDYYGLGANIRWNLHGEREQLKEAMSYCKDHGLSIDHLVFEHNRARSNRKFFTQNDSGVMGFTIGVPVVVPGKGSEFHPVHLEFEAGLSAKFHRFFEDGRATCYFRYDKVTGYCLEFKSTRGVQTTVPLKISKRLCI